MRFLIHFRRTGRILTSAAILISVFLGVSFAQKDAKKTYTFHGKIEKVDRKTGKLTVNGEEVEGWMAAMTMAYRVDNPEVLKNIKTGNWITATVYERDLTLYNVRVVPPTLKQK